MRGTIIAMDLGFPIGGWIAVAMGGSVPFAIGQTVVGLIIVAVALVSRY